MRLQNTLDYLKEQFYTAGEEWKEAKDSELLTELNALVAAINAIEVYLYYCNNRLRIKSMLESKIG
ncbi:hypothetical protein AMS59_15825 [Lysinibacillus sp. FJAT-14745]|uniref:hypothetical protein n=1 Tax=Lysinibacillus sp. FJAT-14745 TaxID=1704289 RepID=UPI0006AB81AB|nr:hypothetical protein [Lysinibacillus sp. FJAT-14745]KOP72398.1 hypothetical protein AMS59_15825 [Lysinibacillus sp. FJAT-14745]